MTEVFRERRKQLLRHLLRNKGGATVDELGQGLGVTRTAIRQHLASLMRDGLIRPGETRASGGRPKQLFVLNTASVSGVGGQGGTMTVSHDAAFGELAGKTVALEPSTGFSFDSPMEVKRR